MSGSKGSFHGIPGPSTSTSSNETLLDPEKRTFSWLAMYRSSFSLVSCSLIVVCASLIAVSRVIASTFSSLWVEIASCSSSALTLTPRTASSIANSALMASIRAIDSATFASRVSSSIAPSDSSMCFSMILSMIGVSATSSSLSGSSSPKRPASSSLLTAASAAASAASDAAFWASSSAISAAIRTASSLACSIAASIAALSSALAVCSASSPDSIAFRSSMISVSRSERRRATTIAI